MAILSKPRPGIPVFHPAFLLSTWFGIGLIARAPGTWGSLAALPFAWGLSLWGGAPVLLAACAVCTLLGWWASTVYVAKTGTDDPKEVVVDEVAGQWLVLATVPNDPLLFALGFVLFRFFDIFKPWPVGWADRHVGGGLGIMLDDLLAGLYGALILSLINLWWSLP